ncbi:hypothetical protein FE697_010205 [Mumia zhuanghuii]|uniref:Substrate-binding domain-containing protein n=2 Tax=Mumia TaxID=1546255 RepID=A0ABW1QQ50_9ACTN|nr:MULTISPECIES: substrate-binding domain-containing protein [Mumia]KAA1423915.1 hypothetical protein FE697_010205 [Mumia zhuanghuii]
MFRTRTLAATAVAGLVASTALLATTPAQADTAPQEKDVVSTGSDILQTAYNFLADGYGDLPGYNTAGNRWRFINFDSSGDAQGRTAYTDPRLLTTITGNGTVGESGVKYVKQSEVQVLNPTVSLRAGQPLVVRPSGGGGGGRDAIINDYVDDKGIGDWIDVGRSPDPVDASGVANQNKAQAQLGTKLYSVQFGTDRQVIATAAVTNAPATLSAETVKKIYKGEITKWNQVPGNESGSPETIIPLTLPDDAGMWNTFLAGIRAANQLTSTTWTDADARSNPNSFNVQQNDPTAITNLPEAQRRNAIVPFPRSRATVVNNGYYTVAQDGAGQTNPYNGTRTYTGSFTSGGQTLGRHRVSATASGIKLLAATSTGTTASDPYGQNFALRAIFRESDLEDPTPWQPGSKLNWARTLFYNPGGATPFVQTPAGKALIEAAGQVPTYRVFGTDNQEIDVD